MPEKRAITPHHEITRIGNRGRAPKQPQQGPKKNSLAWGGESPGKWGTEGQEKKEGRNRLAEELGPGYAVRELERKKSPSRRGKALFNKSSVFQQKTTEGKKKKMHVMGGNVTRPPEISEHPKGKRLKNPAHKEAPSERALLRKKKKKQGLTKSSVKLYAGEGKR